MKAMKQVATPTAIAIGVFFLLSQPTKEFNLDSPLLLYSLAASPLSFTVEQLLPSPLQSSSFSPLPENLWIPSTFSSSRNGKDK